jgi:hypothetical protein
VSLAHGIRRHCRELPSFSLHVLLLVAGPSCVWPATYSLHVAGFFHPVSL